MKQQAKKPGKTVITIKADRVMKEQAQALADELGVTISAVLNRALRKFIEEQSVTFERPLRPTPYLEKILKEARADFKAGRNIDGPFSTAEEIRAYLSARD